MIIKSSPKDFIVEEIPDYVISDNGDYSVYKMSKMSLNTEQAVDMISKRFHIERNSIKYAGSKDKNAYTTQYISIFREKRRLSLNDTNLNLGYVGQSKDPISLGSLKGNRFEIIIREITDEQQKIFIRRAERMPVMPNYFDDQRFSKNNFQIVLAMLKKDFKKASALILESQGYHEDIARSHLSEYPTDYVGAIRCMPKKLLSMYIHSVQSYIFNTILSDRLEEHAAGKGIMAYEVEYSLGKMVFLDALEESDYSASGIDTIPLIGFDSGQYTEHDALLKSLLKDLGIVEKDFIIRAIPDLTTEGASRECFVPITGLQYEFFEDDGGNDQDSDGQNNVKISFALGRSSYATVALKALFAE